MLSQVRNHLSETIINRNNIKWVDSVFGTKSFESYAHQRRWKKKKKKNKSPAWCPQEIPREVSFFFLKSSSVLLLCKYIFSYIDKQACWLTNHAEKVEQTVLSQIKRLTRVECYARCEKIKDVNLKVIVFYSGEAADGLKVDLIAIRFWFCSKTMPTTPTSILDAWP